MMEDNTTTLSYHEEALAIEGKTLSFNDLSQAVIRNNVAHAFENRHQFCCKVLISSIGMKVNTIFLNKRIISVVVTECKKRVHNHIFLKITLWTWR